MRSDGLLPPALESGGGPASIFICSSVLKHSADAPAKHGCASHYGNDFITFVPLTAMFLPDSHGISFLSIVSTRGINWISCPNKSNTIVPGKNVVSMKTHLPNGRS